MIKAIDKLVSLIEKTLKSVSDSMTNELSTSINNEPPQDNAVAKANAQVAAQMGDRVLKGVMRVGLLAKNILLKSDKEVLVCVPINFSSKFYTCKRVVYMHNCIQ